MIARYSVSFISGVVITFALLWVMQVLIATGRKAVVDEQDFSLGDFIRVRKEEIVNRDEDDPEPPPEVEEAPPEMPDVQVFLSHLVNPDLTLISGVKAEHQGNQCAFT